MTEQLQHNYLSQDNSFMAGRASIASSATDITMMRSGAHSSRIEYERDAIKLEALLFDDA